MVRAKFRCEKVTTERHQNDYDYATITLRATSGGSEEDKAFWKATPVGLLEMSTINPDAAAQFKPGTLYYLDITEAK